MADQPDQAGDRPATIAEIEEITGEAGGLPTLDEFLLLMALLGGALLIYLLR